MGITLTNDQYEQLVGLARQGIGTSAGQNDLNQFLATIEAANNITRYFLWVRWQEIGRIHPVNQPFPENWPPTQEIKIERLTNPITREVVEAAVADRGNNPFNILVTPDPGGVAGWSTIDQYFS